LATISPAVASNLLRDDNRIHEADSDVNKKMLKWALYFGSASTAQKTAEFPPISTIVSALQPFDFRQLFLRERGYDLAL
jgi:hypothetical protein